MTPHDKLFDYRLNLTLICKRCGTEWVPGGSHAGECSEDQIGGDPAYHFHLHVREQDARCPVCNAHESIIAGFRQSQRDQKRY